MLKDKKAVCLISGGIDSCVSSFIAKDQGFKIFSLSFNYGQKHLKEINCAKTISKYLKVENHIIFDIDLKEISKSALTNKDMKIPDSKKLENIGNSIPITYVPGRNTIFLSISLAYAEVINAEVIFIGANSLDYSGYPDCRPEYFKEFNKLAEISNKKGIEGNPIKIITPLLNLNKSEIIKRGLNLKVPFDKTWSCYKGGNKACGKCESCLLRLMGFKDAGLKDPIDYQNLPEWY